jgi:hypothetical protein
MEGRELFVKFSKLMKADFISRVKSISLRDAEIQLEWREVGTSVLLIALSFVLYGSAIFTQFSFIPIMILTSKRGWKEAGVYLTGSFIIFLFVVMSGISSFPLYNGLFLFSADRYAFEFLGSTVGIEGIRFLDYYFLFGIFGIFVGYLVSRNYRLAYVVFLSLSIYIGMFVFVFIISGFIGGFDRFIEDYARFIDIKTNRYVDLYLTQVGNYGHLFSSRTVDYSVMAKKVEIAAEIYKKSVIFGIAPRGGYLIKQLIVIFLSVLLVKFYFKRKLKRASFDFDIKKYEIDSDWVWGLIASWGLVFINLFLRSAVLGIVSWNVAVIFSFLYFLKGLSIIKMIADRLRIPQILQYVVLLFLLFYAFIVFVTIVTGIGVVNIWLEIDEKLKSLAQRREK